ncbi:MAG: hypothetical protein H6839_12070 [Planctomycetes bacterium]|nr:hypothetical protein [Planctomycetota bacterium]
MDTLVIVRKIREAEALADAGKHGDARRLLEPLLTDDALTEAHRKLVHKKIDLFRKQHERMTRIVSRRATSVTTRESVDEADQSSARTAIRAAVRDHSDRPTEISIEKENKSERPTDLTIEKDVPQGAATEVVPKARDVDTEVPERGHRLKVEPRKSHQSSGMWAAIDDQRREVKRPPDPSDSQELAPVLESDSLDTGDDEASSADTIITPPIRDSIVQVVDDDDSAPTISRFSGTTGDKPVHPVGNETPAPWHDTPVPQSGSSRTTSINATPPPVTVRDSVVVSGSDTLAVPALPDKDDDSTYLLADDYFTSRPSARNRERSNPELKALADRLPDDDLRRELALEVVKLREQLENSGKESKREATRAGSRKIEREDRPASGSFHIPASQVNTIVRRAAGTDQIEVHMPGREEDASELQVLRKDSVRGQKAPATPTDRIALAQDYIDANQIAKPGMLKPVATWLGVLVVLGVIAWGIHLGWQSVVGSKVALTSVSEQGVADVLLGARLDSIEDFRGRKNEAGRQLQSKSRGWIVTYDDTSESRITSVTVPGPGYSDTAARQFENLSVAFGSHDLSAAEGFSREHVTAAFGEASAASRTTDGEPVYLRFESHQGKGVLEFRYDPGNMETPVWIRVYDSSADPAPPSLADYEWGS